MSAGVWPGVYRTSASSVADLEALAILEQMIEVAAVGRQIGRVEDRPENPLNVLDVFADADPGAGLGLDIGRAGQMVGMGVGLQHPLDRIAGLAGRLQHGLDGARVDRSVVVVVVEHRVDDGGLLRRRVRHQIADRVGGLVKERPDNGLFRHGSNLLAGLMRVRVLTYILAIPN